MSESSRAGPSSLYRMSPGSAGVRERVGVSADGLTMRLVPWDDEGSVVIGETSSAGSTGSSIVADVAGHHANLPDNATKLAGAMDRVERPFFVWIESSRPEAAAALVFADAPESLYCL